MILSRFMLPVLKPGNKLLVEEQVWSLNIGIGLIKQPGAKKYTCMRMKISELHPYSPGYMAYRSHLINYSYILFWRCYKMK